jgi:hypothetical protein
MPRCGALPSPVMSLGSPEMPRVCAGAVMVRRSLTGPPEIVVRYAYPRLKFAFDVLTTGDVGDMPVRGGFVEPSSAGLQNVKKTSVMTHHKKWFHFTQVMKNNSINSLNCILFISRDRPFTTSVARKPISNT